jgi:hypothetical protein
MNITLRELETDSLWVAEEPFNLFGMPVGARSTIVKLDDGGLWVHSPVKPTAELRAELAAIGPVRCIVAPTHVHTAYPAEWATLYPEAKMFTSPRWKKQLPRPAQVLGEEPEALWSGALKQTRILGHALMDEVEFFHQRTQTLIVCDLMFNLPDNLSPGQKLAAKILGLPFHPAPSRLERIMTSDNKAMRASLERVLAWDFERIIMSHGQIVPTSGRQVLRDGFGWLWQN